MNATGVPTTPPWAGVVCDLDGTLTDNMGLHAEAFEAFMARRGRPPLTRAQRVQLDGRRNRDIFPLLLERALAEHELEACSAEKEALYRERSRGRLRPLAGLEELLEALERAGVGVAVATSAPADNVSHTLAELGLADRLRHVVRGDQVPAGKPQPDVFLAAARLLGVPAARCLAFEDAPLGVQAARAAGMRCIALTTTFTPADFVRHGAPADAYAADFAEFLAGPGACLRPAD